MKQRADNAARVAVSGLHPAPMVHIVDGDTLAGLDRPLPWSVDLASASNTTARAAQGKTIDAALLTTLFRRRISISWRRSMIHGWPFLWTKPGRVPGKAEALPPTESEPEILTLLAVLELIERLPMRRKTKAPYGMRCDAHFSPNLTRKGSAFACSG